MRPAPRLILACLVLLSGASAEQRKLVVISIDGLDARYLKDADRLRLKIPFIRKMMNRGASAEGVVGVVPGDAWPAATTIVTGVAPDEHGVMLDQPPTQTPRVQTLWEAAAAGHRKVALLYWPATTSADVDFNCPQFWEGARGGGSLPFDAIAQRCTPGLVGRISSEYPAFSKAQWDDSTATDGLRYLLQWEQPDLTLVHLTDLDEDEHQTGALSLFSRDVLETDDELIGQAMSKLPSRTAVALVSGYGFETEDFVVRPRVLAGSDAVQVRYGIIGATAAGSAAALRRAIGSKRSGIAREIPLEEVKQFAPALSGWVAAFGTAAGYIPTGDRSGPAVSPGSHRGVHGLWPMRPNYRSVFILWGEGIRAVKLPVVSMLSIAPTFADILGVKLEAAQAPSLWPKIKDSR